VLFSLVLSNGRAFPDSINVGDSLYLDGDDFWLADSGHNGHDPLLEVADRRAPPIWLHPGEYATVDVVFELPVAMHPLELSFSQFGEALWATDTATFRFH
jgi:hypothetical protein